MPRRREQIEIEEKEVDNDAVDISQFLSQLQPQIRTSSPYSLINKLLPIENHPATMIYGPSKVGKTRISMWEATALARVMNRKILAVFTESNMEKSDFADLLGMCMYHNVQCELVKLDHLKGIVYYIDKINRTVMNIAKKHPEELSKQPTVYVIDSITALSELVTSSLSASLLSNPTSTIPHQNQYQIAVIDPLRRVVAENIISGYLILTAHETQTRGEPYNPNVPFVKAKPRYVSAGKYKEDAEIYFTDQIPDSLKTCKDTASGNWRGMRAVVVVRSRRNPETEGKGLAFEFVKVNGSVKGNLEVERGVGNVVYRFTPEDMIEEEDVTPVKLKYSVLVPQIRCGPKKI